MTNKYLLQGRQNSKVTYLGCVLSECLTGKSRAMQICEKVSSEPKVLYRKNRFLSKDFRRLLWNTLIQPHFDYACVAWHPNLDKKNKNRLQVLQNQCMRFYLQMDSRERIGTEHFGKINWLLIDQRFKQCLSTTVFKFFSEMCPQYMNKTYATANQNNTVARNSSLKLFQLLRTKALAQKCLPYLRPFTWNGLPDDVKLCQRMWIRLSIR